MNTSTKSTWFKGLRGKLLAMIAIPVFAMAILGVVIFRTINNVVEDVRDLTKNRIQATEAVGDMRASINEVMRSLLDLEIATEHPQAQDRVQAVASVEAGMKEFEHGVDRFKKFENNSDSKKIFESVTGNWTTAAAVIGNAIALGKSGEAANGAKIAALIAGRLHAESSQITSTLRKVDDFTQTINEAVGEDAIHTAESVETVVLWSFLAICSVLTVFGLGVASKLAGVLGGITTKLADAGSQVAAAGEQLSAASQQVSSGSTEAAAALQETVSSVEEMSSIVKLNADHAKEAAVLSSTSSRAATDGETEIRQLIASMAEIQTSSKKIEEIINVIDDIAFQTNLLALNAAVEAARAGEQGKGFAVVAEAVRSLAQRSAAAAKDINTLIKDSADKTDRGSKVADRAGDALKNIVHSIKKVADLNNEIASASIEQANGISQISKAMNELDTSVQQNASASEEVAASSEEMASQADVLNNLVEVLYATVEGNHGAQHDAETYHAHKKTTRRSGGVKSLQEHRAKKQASSRAAHVIPFDDDMPSGGGGKVGNTGGF